MSIKARLTAIRCPEILILEDRKPVPLLEKRSNILWKEEKKQPVPAVKSNKVSGEANPKPADKELWLGEFECSCFNKNHYEISRFKQKL